MDSHSSLTAQYGTYSNVFNYYAVFEPVLASIAVKSNNTSLGRAICSKYDNKQHDVVTIKAYCVDYDTKFLGWEVNGEIISTENPYTFEVTNEATNSDETVIYTAVFDNGYKFHRIRNYVTKNYLNAINDEGNSTSLVAGGEITSLELKSSDLRDVMYEAGSIVEIYYDKIPNDSRYYYDYFVQGAKASKYYDFDPDDPNSHTAGVFIRMPYDAKTYTNTWAFATSNEGGMRFTDSNGTPKITMGERPESQWYIECLDKDLETKENYFSLDPAKLIQLGEEEYYTTLRTSWDILFNPEQMTPYVVTTVVDETSGTFEMEPLEGNIIPKGTPVIIKTKSTDIEENRMVPIISNATKPTVNELTSSEKYFPDQSVSTSSNYKKLMVKDGQLAFGGDALSTVNGNEAYLSVANDVILPNKIPNVTLAELLESDDTEKTYCVTDLTCVYARGKVLYCKDDNKAIRRSEMNEGEIDYVNEVAGLHTGNWDQSNWIAVKLPSEAGSSYLDHRLTNVVGRLTNVVNPELEVTAAPTIGAENPYSENTYITCNFSGSHQENVTINGVEHNYYFVEPKPMEIANVKWALWNGETFSKPSNASSDLKGEFAADFSFSGEPSSAGVYNFPALIKIAPTAQGIMPRAQDEATTSWVVYPLELSSSPVTAVEDLSIGKAVTGIVYYNMMGVASKVPHPGVNIVETRYSDGTRTTTKIIR